MSDVPSALAEHRRELSRRVEGDEEAAALYVEQALELRRAAEIGRAELAGIDRAIAAYREGAVERLVPRREPYRRPVEDED